MRNYIFLLIFISQLTLADDNFKVTELDYKIGTMQSVLESKKNKRNFANLEVKWEGFSGQCNEFDLDFSIINQLKSGDIKRLQNQAVRAFYQAFDPVNLVGKVLKDSNPDLYEMLQNGVLQAQINFDESLIKCQNMQDKFFDMLPNASLTHAANATYIGEIVNQGLDIVPAIKSINGNAGITILDEKQGGINQKPIKPILLASTSGFNALLGRELNDKSPISNSIKNTNHIAKVFKDGKAVNDYLIEIIGDLSISTCQDCEQKRSVPNGLYSLIAKSTDFIFDEISKLINYDLIDLSKDKLDKFNQNQILKINRDAIIALKNLNPEQLITYTQSLSWDMAFANEVDKLLLARRILIAGATVNKIGDIDVINSEIMKKVTFIEKELSMIEQEIRIRKIAKNSTLNLLLERNSIKNSTTTPFNLRSDYYE